MKWQDRLLVFLVPFLLICQVINAFGDDPLPPGVGSFPRVSSNGVFQRPCASLAFGSNLTATRNGDACDIDGTCSCSGGLAPSTTIDYFEDFWGSVASEERSGTEYAFTGVATATGGGTVCCSRTNSRGINATEFDRPGVQVITPCNETNKGCMLLHIQGNVGSHTHNPRAFYALANTTGWKLTFAVQLGDLTNSIYLMGFTSEATLAVCGSRNCISTLFTPVDFIGFRYEASASSRIQLYSCSASTCSGTDITAVTVAANTWYKFTLDMSDSSNLRGQIDATTAVTKSTNLPSNIALTMGLGAWTKTTAEKPLHIDYVWYHATVSR